MTIETIFDEPSQKVEDANGLRGIYLFLTTSGDIWLLGSAPNLKGSRQYKLRLFSKTSKNTIIDVLLPSEFTLLYAEGTTSWLYDPDADGVWTADYGGRPALFGFDGKLKRSLDTGQPPLSGFSGRALARDAVSKDLFVANHKEVLRFNKEGKVSLIWKAPEDPLGGSVETLCPVVKASVTDIERNINVGWCEVKAMRMKSDTSLCKSQTLE